jgi:hypothetical protein
MSTQDWQQTPPPKQGMSGTTKLLLILGGLGGVLALVCCGGFIYMAVWAQSLFSIDPAVVRERSGEIAQVDVPPEITPLFALKMPTMYDVARFSNSDSGAEVIIAQRGTTFAQLPKADFALQVETQLSAQSGNTPGHPLEPVSVDPATTRQITPTIRGAAATFDLSEGSKRGNDFWAVNGEFTGANGTVWLRMDLPKDQFTEEQVVDLLEGIQ